LKNGNHAETTITLQVSQDHLDQSRRAAQDAHPEEACGLLLGQEKTGTLIATELKILPNIDQSATRFTIDPRTLYESLIEAEKRGLALVALFHSHPIGAHPSKTDKEFMELWPIPWLIFSTRSNKFGAFILNRGKCRKVRIQVTQ
jgi:proteasome lid subunit RPN8/RPN11